MFFGSVFCFGHKFPYPLSGAFELWNVLDEAAVFIGPFGSQDGAGLDLIGFGFLIALSLVSKITVILPVLQQEHLKMSLPYFSSILI